MTMRILASLAALLLTASTAHAGVFERGRLMLVCHRTANHDLPENTLESLEFAARMGCDLVEIDLRRTLDGQIVLSHDDPGIERTTNGVGMVERSYLDELVQLDAGGWMGERFQGMRIPRLVDALRLARERGIALSLDLKDKGMGADLLALLGREGMLERVLFGGEWADVRALYPGANPDPVAGVNPGVMREEVERLHGEGRFVLASFSGNHHEMDLAGMREAVARGADGLTVDVPRLGADAIGRPVEAKIQTLVERANAGTLSERSRAILELGYYHGFPLENELLRWLSDPEDQVSRAAAVALLTRRPGVPLEPLERALSSPEPTARKNAAWLLGVRAAPVSEQLMHLVADRDPRVQREALLALSRCPGSVATDQLVPLLGGRDPLVRAAASLALARRDPRSAAPLIEEALEREEQAIAGENRPGAPRAPITAKEADRISAEYSGLMKLMGSIALLDGPDAGRIYEREAFRSASDWSSQTSPIAEYQLWDRSGWNPQMAIEALGSRDLEVANRAEWLLINAQEPVLAAVRAALRSMDHEVRRRAIEIVGWRGDRESLGTLRSIEESSGEGEPELLWAIQKIASMSYTGKGQGAAAAVDDGQGRR